MKLQTERFGELEIDEKQIYEFPHGILAFEHLKKYAFINIKETPIFKWLQPVNDPKTAFLIVDPFLIKRDYFVDIDDNIKSELDIEKPEDVLIYTIVTIPEKGFKFATTNLVGPLILNIKKRKGKQIILERDDLSIKHPLFPKEEKDAKTSHGG